MKTYENLRGKRADVRGRQVRANKILFSPLGSLLFPSPPFYFLPASRFIRFCSARSRGCTSPYLYVPLSQREEKKKSGTREKFSGCKFRSSERTRGGGIIRSRRTYTFRGLFAFQLADSCSEETLIGYQEAGKNNEIIVNQYAAWETHLVSVKQSGRSTLSTVALKTSIAYKFQRNTIPSSPEHLIWTHRLDKCHSKFINRLNATWWSNTYRSKYFKMNLILNNIKIFTVFDI